MFVSRCRDAIELADAFGLTTVAGGGKRSRLMEDQVFHKMNGLSLRLDVSKGGNGDRNESARLSGGGHAQRRRRGKESKTNEFRVKNASSTHVRLDLESFSQRSEHPVSLTRLPRADCASSPWSLEITQKNKQTLRVLSGANTSASDPNAMRDFHFGNGNDGTSCLVSHPGFGNPSGVVENRLNALCNLTSLCLKTGGRGIGDAGAVSLARGIRGAVPMLRSLDVSRNDLGATASRALAQALFSVSSETENGPFGVGMLNIGNTNDGCALEVLDLSGNHIGSEGARALAEALVRGGCPKLKKIDVSQNLIGAAGVVAIAEVLVAQATRRGSARESNTFRRHALTELSLRHNGCGDAGVVAIANAMRASAEISVARNLSRDGPTFVSSVKTRVPGATENTPPQIAHSFQVLKLGFNGVGHLGAAALAEAIAWVRQAVRDAGHGDAMDDASGSNRARPVVIHELDLACNAVGAVGARALASALDDGVFELNLGNNAIGCVGAKEFALGLVTNDTTRSLNLSGNEICETGAWWLADFFAKTKTTSELQVLHLGANSVGDAGAADLAEEASEIVSLRRLDLSRNGITRKGALSFCDAIGLYDAARRISCANVKHSPAESPVALSVCLRGNAIDSNSQNTIRQKFGLRIDVEMQSAWYG
jgi:Ran GTPase-activating protein (RanGAP) involved in mRNA processing and transport